MVFEAITVSLGSYITTFVKGPPPRNGSKYVRNGGFLSPSKWGCGGQEVCDDQLVKVQRMVLGFYRPKKDLKNVLHSKCGKTHSIDWAWF